jgi:hypothetical protein
MCINLSTPFRPLIKLEGERSKQAQKWGNSGPAGLKMLLGRPAVQDVLRLLAYKPNNSNLRSDLVLSIMMPWRWIHGTTGSNNCRGHQQSALYN